MNTTKNYIDVDKQNFLSVDKQTARSSYGEFFSLGEIVEHEEDDAGCATILTFEPDTVSNEVLVHTNKGYTHLDFLVKIKYNPPQTLLDTFEQSGLLDSNEPNPLDTI